MALRPLVAGNWKMNGTRPSLAEVDAIVRALAGHPVAADVALCPPALLLREMAERCAGTPVAIGGQDCHARAAGAHTGDISAPMLADAGARFVILGHSERRADHGETSREVRAKVAAAVAAGLTAIVCIGETGGERAAGLTLDVVRRQLVDSLPDGAVPEAVVIAYEPVWAIGTGHTPTVADVATVHAAIRSALYERFGGAGSGFRILYGGSVKGSNARELMAVPDVNGALVGGASLKAADFLAILAAYGHEE